MIYFGSLDGTGENIHHIGISLLACRLNHVCVKYKAQIGEVQWKAQL